MAITPEQFFGLIAVKNGLLTKAQLEQCFRVQAERYQQTGIREPLSFVLCEFRYLDYVQLRDVLQEFKYSCLRKDDKALAQVGLDKGYLTEEQISRVLQKQRDMFRTGIGTFQLGEILITNEILTPQQVFELYCELWLRRHPGRELPPAAVKALTESQSRGAATTGPAGRERAGGTAATAGRAAAAGAGAAAAADVKREHTRTIDRMAAAEPARAADREQGVMRDPTAGFKICAICHYRNPAVADICYGCGESLAGATVVQVALDEGTSGPATL